MFQAYQEFASAETDGTAKTQDQLLWLVQSLIG